MPVYLLTEEGSKAKIICHGFNGIKSDICQHPILKQRPFFLHEIDDLIKKNKQELILEMLSHRAIVSFNYSM